MTYRRRPLIAAAALLAGAASALPATATPPGTNGQILWERDLQAAPHLYAANPDGSGSHALFTTPGEFDGAWSPTGNVVAFNRDTARPFSARIYLGDVGTGAVSRLRTAGLEVFAPTFSADGGRIAFFGHRVPKNPSAQPGNDGIFIANADGTGRRRITPRSVEAIDPDFSPDGTRVAYSESRVIGRTTGQDRIALVGVDGKHRHVLTKYGDRHAFNPKWMPDGRRIVFETGLVRNGRLGKTRSDIAVMGADGTNAVRLLATPAWETNPVPSPDGTRLVFTSDRDRRGPDRRGPGFEVYTMKVDGTDIVRLTNNAVPDVSPDWQRLP